MSGPQRYRYTVTEATAGQVASAVLRYRLTSFASLAPLVVLLVLAVAFAVGGNTTLAVVMGVGVVAVVLAPLATRGRLVRTLQARGFAPGSVVTTEFRAQRFTLETPQGSGVHDYTDVRSVRVVGGVVCIRLGRARYLVVLPEPLVPAEARARLGGRPDSRAH